MLHPHHQEEIDLQENYAADRELILRAEHHDYYPGDDGEYCPNPYAAELDRRQGIASNEDLEYIALHAIHCEEADRA